MTIRITNRVQPRTDAQALIPKRMKAGNPWIVLHFPTPRPMRTLRQRMQRDRPLLTMTEVTPGGDEISGRTMTRTITRRSEHIAVTFRRPSGDRTPTRRAWADPHLAPGGAQLITPLGERRVG